MAPPEKLEHLSKRLEALDKIFGEKKLTFSDLEYFYLYPKEVRGWVRDAKTPVGAYSPSGQWVPLSQLESAAEIQAVADETAKLKRLSHGIGFADVTTSSVAAAAGGSPPSPDGSSNTIVSIKKLREDLAKKRMTSEQAARLERWLDKTISTVEEKMKDPAFETKLREIHAMVHDATRFYAYASKLTPAEQDDVLRTYLSQMQRRWGLYDEDDSADVLEYKLDYLEIPEDDEEDEDALERPQLKKYNPEYTPAKFFERDAIPADCLDALRFGVQPDEIEELKLHEKVKDLLSFKHARNKEIRAHRRNVAAEKYGGAKHNTGDTAVQVVNLTHRINMLNEHLQRNKKDTHSKRTMSILVIRRRNLMRYLKGKNVAAYFHVLKDLNLRDMA